MDDLVVAWRSGKLASLCRLCKLATTYAACFLLTHNALPAGREYSQNSARMQTVF